MQTQTGLLCHRIKPSRLVEPVDTEAVAMRVDGVEDAGQGRRAPASWPWRITATAALDPDEDEEEEDEDDDLFDDDDEEFFDDDEDEEEDDEEE